MSRRTKLRHPDRLEATPSWQRPPGHTGQAGNGPQGGTQPAEPRRHRGCGWCGAPAPEIGSPIAGWTWRKLTRPFRWGPVRVAPCSWYACPPCSADLDHEPPRMGAILRRRGGPTSLDSDRQALMLALHGQLGPQKPLAEHPASQHEEKPCT